VRILYRSDGSAARVDLSEEPWRTELDPQERELLVAFSAALPDIPEEIDLADGIGFYMLTHSGKWTQDQIPTMYAEYGLCVDFESPLPWPPPTEEQKAPGRAALVHIRQAVNDALSDWESNDFTGVVQKLEDIEREAHDLIEAASKLIKNYVR
jgi:hypothetical protein